MPIRTAVRSLATRKVTSSTITTSAVCALAIGGIGGMEVTAHLDGTPSLLNPSAAPTSESALTAEKVKPLDAPAEPAQPITNTAPAPRKGQVDALAAAHPWL